MEDLKKKLQDEVKQLTDRAKQLQDQAKGKDKAEAAYARSDVFEKRRKMMEAWAGYLCDEGKRNILHVDFAR